MLCIFMFVLNINKLCDGLFERKSWSLAPWLNGIVQDRDRLSFSLFISTKIWSTYLLFYMISLVTRICCVTTYSCLKMSIYTRMVMKTKSICTLWSSKEGIMTYLKRNKSLWKQGGAEAELRKGSGITSSCVGGVAFVLCPVNKFNSVL